MPAQRKISLNTKIRQLVEGDMATALTPTDPNSDYSLPMHSVASEQIAFKANVAVLTSGGDAQGMNAAVRAIVRVGILLRAKVFFIKEGYQGLVDGGERIEEANWAKVSDILQLGGTAIGSARCMDFKEHWGQLAAAKNLVMRGITNLVVIGGDGSLTGANRFKLRWTDLLAELQKNGDITPEQQKRYHHLSVVGLVGSIDNDFCGTDMTIGADSALHRIMECVDALRTTAQSHQRTFVLEVMGRHCGYLALITAIASAADWVFLPEDPPEDGWEDEMCEKLEEGREAGQRLCIVVVAEGATDRQGNPITPELVRDVIKENTDHDTRVTTLGHVQRGGSPSAFDRLLGTRMGAEAVYALRDSVPGTPAHVISISGNKEIRVPLIECVEKTQAIGKALQERRFEDALNLRGRSFLNNLEIYRTLNNRHVPENANALMSPQQARAQLKGIVQEHRSQVVAVLNVGNPCPGMNAAVRAVVRTVMFEENFKVLLVSEGFDGFYNDEVEVASWRSVSGFLSQGGSILGTNRNVPQDLGQLALKFEKYNVCGLVVIGGFQAFESVRKLYDAREDFRQFCIPIVCIPASISNNVPGSELSIGCDTSLNAIVKACDIIKQSAQGTRKRVFVLETFGGNCGYLATMAGIACGADAAYIQEERFTIEDLRLDVVHLAKKIRDGMPRGLIIRNEKASQNYTTKFIESLYNEEGKGIFSCRANVLGHMQEGGHPTPFDRNLASKMGMRAGDWMVKKIVENLRADYSVLTIAKDTVCLLGMLHGKLNFQPITELDDIADFKLARPKTQWWMRMRPLMRIMAKHDNLYVSKSTVAQSAAVVDEAID